MAPTLSSIVYSRFGFYISLPSKGTSILRHLWTTNPGGTSRLTGANRDVGSTRWQPGQALLLLQSRRPLTAQSLAAGPRSLLRSRRTARPPRAVLQPHRPPINRP